MAAQFRHWDQVINDAKRLWPSEILHQHFLLEIVTFDLLVFTSKSIVLVYIGIIMLIWYDGFEHRSFKRINIIMVMCFSRTVSEAWIAYMGTTDNITARGITKILQIVNFNEIYYLIPYSHYKRTQPNLYFCCRRCCVLWEVKKNKISHPFAVSV